MMVFYCVIEHVSNVVDEFARVGAKLQRLFDFARLDAKERASLATDASNVRAHFVDLSLHASNASCCLGEADIPVRKSILCSTQAMGCGLFLRF
jgi:hypothetical protein